MVWKKIALIVFCLFFVYLFRVDGVGYGVSPGSYQIDFQPNLEESFEFEFLFDDPNQEFELVMEGELKEYVDVEKIPGSSKVVVNLKLPQKIEKPGPNRVKVGARAISGDKGSESSKVGISALVSGTIIVHVPYPGKYAEAQFSIENANAGEPVKYKMIIFSKGEENIVATPRIEIFDSENKSVETFNSESKMIETADYVEINSELDVSSYNPGNYKAVATIDYTGQEKPIVIEDTFRLGELSVSILNYTKEAERKKINPFFVEVESNWNDPLQNVFAEIEVVGSNITAKTPSVGLEGFRSTRLNGFLDLTNYESEDDEFQVELKVNYQDKMTEEIVNVKFKEK